MARAAEWALFACLAAGALGIQVPLGTRGCEPELMEKKDIDLLVYGVTGFVGKLAAMHLVNHRAKPRWAIGGREQLSLDYVKALVSENNANPPESHVFELRDNDTRMGDAVRRAKAVVNFAGPFESANADALIRAAVAACAHYVDISGETRWNARVLRQQKASAEERGTAIVQAAGFNSAVSDLLAMSAIQDVVDAGKSTPTNVMVVWTDINDAVSGGQIATVKKDETRHVPNNDPYALAPEISEDMKLDYTVDGMEGYGLHKGFGNMLPASLAARNCPVVRRSMMLRFPTSPISMREAYANSSLQEKRHAFLNNPPNDITNPLVQPVPLAGEGPPVWVLRHGSFGALAIAKGQWNGDASALHESRVTVQGRGDPFFMGSARIATEVALSLASSGPVGKKGGYLTPTAAIGVRELEQLLTKVDGGKLMTVTHE